MRRRERPSFQIDNASITDCNIVIFVKFNVTVSDYGINIKKKKNYNVVVSDYDINLEKKNYNTIVIDYGIADVYVDVVRTH